MRLLQKLNVILLLGATAACATPGPQRIADTSCLAFRAISYAELPAGAVDDPANEADTPATVEEIEAHNAKFDALCPISGASNGR